MKLQPNDRVTALRETYRAVITPTPAPGQVRLMVIWQSFLVYTVRCRNDYQAMSAALRYVAARTA